MTGRSLLMVVLAILVTVASTSGVGQQAPPTDDGNGESLEAHLAKGHAALIQSKYDEAANEFRAALQMDPKLALRARYPLALALFQTKQYDEARKEFESVHREIGDHPNVLYYLGRLDLEDRKFAGAIENLSKAVVKPPFPDTAYYLGYAYLKHGDLAAAEKWLNAAIAANPRDRSAPYQLGFVYRQLGREEDAKKAFALSSELVRREVEDDRARYQCRQSLDQGLRDEARTVCQHFYDPDDAEKLTSLGLAFGEHGDYDAALKPFQRAAELTPQQPRTQYNLAFTYYQLNRFEDARKVVADAVQRWPDQFLLSALYGAVLVKLGDDTAAYPVLIRAHDLNREDPQVGDLLFTTALTLGQKSLAQHQYADSLRYFEEAANLRPDDPEAHQGKAEAEQEQTGQSNSSH
ncbi:MAG: tetratricopeptide repeat protein [Bryobacteraceae bacterium]